MQNHQAAAARRRARSTGKVGLVGLVVVIAVIAGLGGLAWYLGQRTAAGPGAGGPPGMGPGGPGSSGSSGAAGGGRFATTVGVATAIAEDLPVTLEALGTVTPVATVTVRPQVSGVITEIRFLEGQRVTRGQVLAVIDRRPFQMELQQAEGNLLRDEAQLQNAQLQLERYRTLLAQDSIAQQEVDAQAATVRQLQGTVASDRAAVGTARLNLDYSEVKSPIAGRTGLRVVDVGNYVSAGDASGLVVVTQVSPTDVSFTVPQDRVGEILAAAGKGSRLAATALDRSRTEALAEGQFLTLDNLVSTDTGTVRAKARFDNADGTLFPNQFVNLRLTLRTLHDAVTVPVAAVRNGNDGDFVWRLNDDQTVSQRRIERGITAANRVQVRQGLQPGDRVVTEGGDRLRDGATVQLPSDKPATAAGATDPGKKRERRRRDHGQGGTGGPGSPGGAAGPGDPAAPAGAPPAGSAPGAP